MATSNYYLTTPIWQDREVRFDNVLKYLECHPGEVVVDTLGEVEDTKGNNGERGRIMVTNLRVIWYSQRRPRTNLSIGFDCIITITVRQVESGLRGRAQALYVLTRHNGTRYEFIFTNLVAESPRLFTTVQSVHRAYGTSRLYRDIKLRGAIVKDKQLQLLAQEQIYDKVNGVWSLYGDQGNLGTFLVTNVRLVWHAQSSDNFNVSIPYLQMKSVRVRDSKFGMAIVVETFGQGKGHLLGFRIDPKERLREVMKEIQNLHKVYAASPIFGVDVEDEETMPALEHLTVEQVPDDVEITEEEATDAFAAYYADVGGADRPPIYSEEIGLAVETPMGKGRLLKDLWAVK